MRGAALVFALCACSDPPARPFTLPQNVEDLRARLLVAIPEGREMAGALSWMRAHGFACDAPLPSATEAHATVCRLPEKRWTVVLIDRNGRLQDVQARSGV
jgi:hypothetical protein